MEASLIAGSMPVSPAPLRKAASTRSICHHSSSAADLLGSTQSSAPPRRSESLPRLGGYDLRVLESHAASPLPPPVYRIPRWQRAGWTFSPQADDLPVHEGTQTEDLACDDNEGPSSSGTYGEVAGRSMFGRRLPRRFKWGTPPMLLSLAALVLFVVALVIITMITGTVITKIRNIERLYDVLEKEETAEDDAPASGATEAPQTATVRRPWRALVRTSKATDKSKMSKTVSFLERTTKRQWRTVPARRPTSTTVSELPTARGSSAPSATPRLSSAARSTPAAGTVKRTSDDGAQLIKKVLLREASVKLRPQHQEASSFPKFFTPTVQDPSPS